MSAALRPVNLALAFVLELCLLAAFAWWGWQTGDSLPWKIVLAVGAPVLVAGAWGLWLAPRAARPLPRAANIALKVILFALGAAALIAVGLPVLGWALALLFLLNLLLALLWGQE